MSSPVSPHSSSPSGDTTAGAIPDPNHPNTNITTSNLKPIKSIISNPRFDYHDQPTNPEVYYTDNAKKAGDAFARIQGSVIGVDVRWGYKGEWDKRILNNWKGEVGRTGLITVCDENLIVMYQIKDKGEYSEMSLGEHSQLMEMSS